MTTMKNGFALVNTYRNDLILSRHRTIEAVARAKRIHDRKYPESSYLARPRELVEGHLLMLNDALEEKYFSWLNFRP